MPRTRWTPPPEEERRSVIRVRTYAAPLHYTVLLLKAIRDGTVRDWDSLASFQTEHDLRFISWGSSLVGEAPAVISLLKNLELAGLVIVEGARLDDIWVRTDNFTPSPAGRVVYENGLDRHHRLDGPDVIPTSALKIRLSPQWETIQRTLGISLTWLADLQHPRARIVVPEAFPEPSRKQIPADVFIAMPFDKELAPVDREIRKVCKELSLSVARGDDFFTVRSVMADVWGAMQNAMIVVADCTDRNANVFYEIGIAHVLGKPVVLVTQNERDIPFDLRQIRHISYDNTPTGMKAFHKALRPTLHALRGWTNRPD